MNIRINKIILFGSYATGNQKEGNDIDAVVISDDFNNKDYWDRINILSRAIYKVFEPIEAVAFTPDEWEKADKDIIIFAKSGEAIE